MSLSASLLFGLRVGIGLLLGYWFLWWIAYQQPNPQPRRWLDAYLVMLLGGIIGGRIGYILLHLDYFRDLPSYIPRLWFAELTWQGAFIGATVVLWIMSRFWSLDLHAFLDGLALSLPIGFMAIWWGCRGAGCGLADMVIHREDFPVWMVGYVRDSKGYVELRYELQMLGIAFGLLIFIIIGWLTLRQQFPGQRIWIVLSLLGTALLPLEYWQVAKEHQALDLLSAVLLIIIGFIGVRGSAKRRQNVVSTSEKDQL